MAGLRTYGLTFFERDLLCAASQADITQSQCQGAGRSRLPLRGSSGFGFKAAPDSLLSLPISDRHHQR
jgi:hypothetical protein